MTDKLPPPFYQDEHATLYCGDAREILPLLSRVDVVLTDPIWPGASVDLPGAADPLGLFWEVAPLLVRLAGARRVIVQLGDTTDPRMLAALGEDLSFLRSCWLRFPQARRRGPVMSRADIAYIFGEAWLHGDAKAACRNLAAEPLDFPSEVTIGGHVEPVAHPCPRSLRHVEWLVRNYTKPGMTILDPFAGSGTTLLAAARTGRKAVGIEISETFCEEAARRLRAHRAQTNLPLEDNRV